MPKTGHPSRALEPPAFWLTGAFALLLFASAWHHVFWGDEAQAWLLARDSATPIALLHNVRYEGHPPLWHLVLWCITRFTRNPEWMKLPNALSALAAATLIMTVRRLPLWVRAGVVFSYFFAFEYSVVNRNYMIGIALLLAAVRCMETRRRELAVPLLLSFAALTSLMALIVAVCLFGWWLADRRQSPETSHRTNRQFATGLVVFAASIAFAVWMIHPPPDSAVELSGLQWRGGQVAAHRFAVELMHIQDAFLPIPRWTQPFWGSPALNAAPALRAILAPLLPIALSIFFRRRSVRWFFLAASSLLLLEFFITRRGYERHAGWLFVAFVLALLLEARSPTPETVLRSGWRPRLLAALLVAQLAGAAIALERSLQYLFTPARQAAEFLVRNHLQQAPLVMQEGIGTSLVAYTGRSVYYPGRGKNRSFNVWDRGWHTPDGNMQPADLAAAREGNETPILVMAGALSKEQQATLHVNLLASFEGPTCKWEPVFLYR